MRFQNVESDQYKSYLQTTNVSIFIYNEVRSFGNI